MKKIFSFVLMAVMTLLGTNAWAQQKTVRLENETNPEKNGNYATLQAAVNAVDSGEVATITLLDNQTLTAPVVIPQVSEASTSRAKVANRPRQIITLNMNGYDINTSASYYGSAIILLKGKLDIIGEGTISRDGENWKGSWSNFSRAAIVVCGADGRNPNYTGDEEPDRSKQEWSTLTIGKNVVVTASGHSGSEGCHGIAIQDISPATGNGTYFAGLDEYIHYANLGYSTFNTTSKGSNPLVNVTGGENGNPMWDRPSTEQGSAFGVKLIIEGEVYGYRRGINIVGHINQSAKGVEGAETRKTNKYPFYDHYYPYIKIEKGAKVHCADNDLESGNGGIYGGGWCVIDISGEVYGQTGVYLKGGDVVVSDGTVYSTSETSYNNGNYGGNVSGNAIFISSDAGYAGNTGVTIEGDSKITGNGGTAITDVVAANNNGEATVEHVTITGGTIEGGAGGAIAVTTGTAESTVVYGGGIEGTVTKDGEAISADEITAEDTHVTTVVVDGKTTIVVSQGAAPTEFANVAGNAKDSVKWTGTAETLTEDLTLTALTINEMDGVTPVEQVLTVGDEDHKVTLKVGHVVLGEKAQIIVHEGSTFIVTGTQGIHAPKTSNIILKASETEQAIFLFNPAISSNRHPNATVEFTSKAFNKPVYQRIGIPTFDGECTIESKTPGYGGSWLTRWDYEAGDWGAWQAFDGDNKLLVEEAEQFEGYILASNNTKENKMKYEFTGSLMGNVDGSLHFNPEWNNYANNYTAPIDIAQFVTTVRNTVENKTVVPTVYLYRDMGNDTYKWQAVNLGNANDPIAVGFEPGVGPIYKKMNKINPLQAFLMYLYPDKEVTDQTINYTNHVYNPTVGGGSPAPARATQAQNKMQVSVYNTEGAFDNIMITESEEFSREMDEGYDAIKYENVPGLKFYAMNNDARMEILATDYAEGTFLGINAPKEGTYTLYVSGVNDMPYAIVDMQTNTAINVQEGASYTFFAEEGENDYRFQIVGLHKVVTGIEESAVDSTIKGIYTIMGHYVGQDINILPAGVYVVNGVKVVK